MIVQLPPGGITEADVHVPPVIEKVPAPAVFVIVGAAMNVNDPAFAPFTVFPLLVNVMVPFFVVVLAVVVVNAGEGPVNSADAPVTRKPTGPAVPLGTVTSILWSPSVVVAPRFKVAVTDVELTATKLLTVIVGEPGAVTAEAPVKLVPAMDTGTLVPRTPELGVIEESAGPVTVNVTVLLVPPAVVTETVLAPSVALLAIVNVACTKAALTTPIPLTVMPVPDTFTALVPVRRVPLRTTATLVPCEPEEGVIEFSTGTGLPRLAI